VIGILYGLIGLAIRRSTLLTRAGSDTSARSSNLGGHGANDRILQAGCAEQQRAQQLQTRARLAVIKMLGMSNYNVSEKVTSHTVLITEHFPNNLG